MKKIIKISALITAAVIMTGCANKNKTPTKQDLLAAEKIVINDMASDGVIVSETSALQARDSFIERDGYTALNNANVSREQIKLLLDNNVVNFKFDSYELDEVSKNKIKIHIDFLKQNNNIKVILEGHTDERGDLSYNLNLGEKRAKAVRDFMIRNGVSSGQLETVSFGETRPIDNSSNERAWSLNRRAVFVY